MSPDPRQIPASFRDPHGTVFVRDETLYRQIGAAHLPDYQQLMGSGLYEELTETGSLVGHVEVDRDLAITSDAALVIQPDVIRVITYPYEWGWAQLRDAALLTLSIQSLAMRHEMTLRDASAFNVSFERGRPVFIDTTSIGILEPGRPWVAYRQFCQHFLAPLALMSYRDARLGTMTREHLDGIPLDLATALLPRRATARPGLAMHLRMHAGSQRRHENDRGPADLRGFSSRAFQGLIESLGKTIEALPEPAGPSVWRDYDERADHYSDAATTAKEEIVRRWLQRTGAGSVLDLGANTGRFSRLAADAACDVVSVDADPHCIDQLYRDVRRRGEERITAAVIDLTNPTPGLGWAGLERSPVTGRIRADAVFALALIHHLAITGGVPLPMILVWLAELSRRWAIVEWVPKHDPMTRRLLQGREDIFDRYDRDGFESAMGASWRIAEREEEPDSDRTMYLLERL
jgi:SAM-dependent methyltransferase